MNIERGWFFSIMAIMVLITMNLADVCRADDRARDRKTLKGIQSVVVKVHAVEADWQAELQKAGLSESVLQASIEHQLRKAGIK